MNDGVVRKAGNRQLAALGGVLVLACFALRAARCPLHAASAADSLIASAADAWADRDQEGRTLAAIALWQQALTIDPEQKTLWIKLTQAMGRAVRHAATPEEARQWAKRAVAAGKQAILEDPKSAEAHAFYAEALGQYANTHKGLGSLKKVRQAESQLKQAIHLNPRYAYAHMLLSSFYLKAPGVISIGDKSKALEEARIAVEYAPGYAINHLTLAKALLETGHQTEAIEQLQKILILPAPADAIPETRADQATARSMLSQLGIPPALPVEEGVCSESIGGCHGTP